MQALTVIPRQAGTIRLQDIEEPAPADGDLLVQTVAIGVCGTDLDIVAGLYGWPPVAAERLVIGHESLGRVIAAPAASDFSVGNLVAGIVRRPDPVPCQYCAVGEWDMCRNGRYTERGIKELNGYASDRFALETAFAVKVDPRLGALGVLLEPASVVAKAWDHAERIGGRSSAWQPRTALITGAGPIGLLAALMGRQRGLEVTVFDRVTDGPKPALVDELGATYLSGPLPPDDELSADVIIECTGASSVIADVLTRSAASGILCLAGVSSGGHTIDLDVGQVNRRIVLENDAIFGSVNANRSHYVAAAAALAAADPQWLARLITRRVPLRHWHEAFERHPHDVKVVIEFAPA